MEILLAVTGSTLSKTPISWSSDACVGVVIAPRGYPGPHAAGTPISGLTQAETHGLVFHAGTRKENNEESEVVTTGGRVLTMVGKGPSLDEAKAQAYEGIAQIHFEGGFHRRDIADGLENR